jgi:molybdopterin-containing oxidoreductase family membrane subunit
MAARTTITATFADIHSVVGATRSVRQEGCENIIVFGPIMEHELEDAIGKPPSPVRRYALIGGLTGCIGGFALTIWSSYYYPLVVGGKALASIPAYVVIAFEMTILFAGISALIGMLIHNRMPRARLHPKYDPSYSADRFGVRISCDSTRSSRLEDVLRSYGPDEVKIER